MQVRDRVRERRLDRIRAIQEGQHGHNYMLPEQNETAAPQQQAPQAAEPMTEPEDPRMDDPEYVWKQARAARWNMPDHPGWSMTPISGRKAPPKPPARRTIWGKLIICLLLFAGLWGMFHIQQPWAVFGQGYVRAALTQSYDFTSVAAWYERTFKGAPSFLPAFHIPQGNESRKVNAGAGKGASFDRPLAGTIAAPFSPNHPWIQLQVAANQTVDAIGAGWVTYVGNENESGLTVEIRHTDGYTSEYGLLGQTPLKANDWVQQGDPVGTSGIDASTGQGQFYFAMTKDGQYINPADVVTFD